MRVFRLLGARRLRVQPLKAAIAVVAVAAGVALAVAVLVTTASIDRSVREFGRGLAGPAPLRIVGATARGGLLPEAVAAAEQLPGVQAVVPVVQAVAIADPALPTRGGPGTTFVVSDATAVDVLVLGVDCRVGALFGGGACDDAAFAAAGDGIVAVGPGLATALGGDLTGATVRSDAGRIPLDGVPVLDELAPLAGGRVALQSIEGAQHRFLQEGEFDVAYVVLAPGADVDAVRTALEGAVGEHNGVLTGDEPPPQVEGVLIAFLPLFSLLALFGLGTGAVLVRNTLVLSIEERRRQLAVLGALGARGRTVVGGLVAESAVLGLVGGAIGTLGGAALAGPIVASLSTVTEDVAGIPLERHLPVSTVFIGVCLGAAVAAITAVLPARRALRLDIAAELSGRDRVEEARTPRLVRRLAVWSAVASIGLALGAVAARGGSLEPWQAVVGPLALLVTSVASLLVGTATAPLLARRVAQRLRDSRRSSLVLAVASLVRDPRRTGVLACAIAAPIVVAFVADGFTSSARRSIEAEFDEDAAGVSVSTVGVNGGDDAFLSRDAVAALAALPGVERVESGHFLVLGSTPRTLTAVRAFDGDPSLGDHVVDGTADVARFEAGEVLVGTGLARREGIRSGDTVRLPTPSGFVELPVQGVIEDGAFGGLAVTVPHELLVRQWGAQPPSFTVLRPAEGTSEAELAGTVRRAAFDIDPHLRVWTSTEVAAAIGESIESQMVPFRVLQQGLLLVAFVAVISTLLLSGYQRRREHGLLAAVGAEPRHLGRTVVAEAALVSGASLVQAAVFGPVMLWSLLQVIPLAIGISNPFRPDWASLATAGGVTVVVAVLAALWPAWRAGRVDVLDALRYE